MNRHRFDRAPGSPPLRGSAPRRSGESRRRGSESLSGKAGLLFGGGPRRVAIGFWGTRRIVVGLREGQLQHPWHAAFAEVRIAEQLVMHVDLLSFQPRLPSV